MSVLSRVGALVLLLLIPALAASPASADFDAIKYMKKKFERIYKGSHEKYERGTAKDPVFYRVKVKDLNPTQFVVGEEEVLTRATHIESLGQKALAEYLEGKPGQVVIGPGGKIYLTDGHHLASALAEGDMSTMIVKVRADWSNLSEVEFFQRMINQKLVWPYDANGKGPLTARQLAKGLPTKIPRLGNDPFRSLAWKVKAAGGFKESTVDFAQFKWGQFFREHISAEELENNPEKAFKKAMRLSVSPEAKKYRPKLPGYTGNKRCLALNGIKPKAVP